VLALHREELDPQPVRREDLLQRLARSPAHVFVVFVERTGQGGLGLCIGELAQRLRGRFFLRGAAGAVCEGGLDARAGPFSADPAQRLDGGHCHLVALLTDAGLDGVAHAVALVVGEPREKAAERFQRRSLHRQLGGRFFCAPRCDGLQLFERAFVAQGPQGQERPLALPVFAGPHEQDQRAKGRRHPFEREPLCRGQHGLAGAAAEHVFERCRGRALLLDPPRVRAHRERAHAAIAIREERLQETLGGGIRQLVELAHPERAYFREARAHGGFEQALGQGSIARLRLGRAAIAALAAVRGLHQMRLHAGPR